MIRSNSNCVLLFLAAAFLLTFGTAEISAQPSRLESKMDAQRRQLIVDAIQKRIEVKKVPGAVVCIGTQDDICFLQAFGHRQLVPSKDEMTVDTLFDLASLTKPIATATSIMILVEQGKVRLRDPVATYIPEFAQKEKGRITVHQLMTHTGGLIPDNALKDYKDGYDLAMKRINALPLYTSVGDKFKYTDVGFIVLAEIVKRVSGKNVHEFSRDEIFRKLGMDETGYLPQASLQSRAATTEKRDGKWIKGEVHDPRAFELGGVAGHAGLFSTASDLAKYAQMMLAKGKGQKGAVLSPKTFELMTQSFLIADGNKRALGWDKLSVYSSNRGELMSEKAFGHGGFTGTSIWIDPELDLFVIFLSNRVHPDGKGSINRLAGRIGTVAAGWASQKKAEQEEQPNKKENKGLDATLNASQPFDATKSFKTKPVLTGLDNLIASDFAILSGKRIGLISNQTSIDRSGRTSASILNQAKQVQLTALFSPEHGFKGVLDQSKIADSTDSQTGLKIFSLYGKTRKPTPEMLANVDMLVFDIQDIGTRFYTYISTMGLAMNAAAEKGIPFVVLDRPNPINGIVVDGPVLDRGTESFVGYHSIAVRHGMTAGELAQMIKTESELDLDLRVIKISNWKRGQYFDQTNLLWINPSPNMRNLNQAILYPGIGLLEMTNLSVGRGTDTPFEIFGAPWIAQPEKLAAQLNSRNLQGVSFVPVWFTPDSSKFKDQKSGGVQILITNRSEIDPTKIGFVVAKTLRKSYPKKWDVKKYSVLLCDQNVMKNVVESSDVEAEKVYRGELLEFMKRRKGFLIYP